MIKPLARMAIFNIPVMEEHVRIRNRIETFEGRRGWRKNVEAQNNEVVSDITIGKVMKHEA